MQRKLQFDNEKCIYLLLNMIHDIIHDYGNADSERWYKVKEILNKFYDNPDNISSGGDPIVVLLPPAPLHTSPLPPAPLQSASLQPPPPPPPPPTSSKMQVQSAQTTSIIQTQQADTDTEDRYNNVKFTLKKFINDIMNEIIMNIFVINYSKFTDISGKEYIINITDCITPTKKKNETK